MFSKIYEAVALFIGKGAAALFLGGPFGVGPKGCVMNMKKYVWGSRSFVLLDGFILEPEL